MTQIADISTPSLSGTADAPLASQRAPLAAVLGFTFINSYATGTTFNGVNFIAKEAYGFTALGNSLLGLLLGVTYVAGAMLTGKLVRAWRAGGRGVSTRGVLARLVLIATGLNALPVIVWALSSDASRGSTVWVMCVYLGLYAFLCGSLWPVVESFLSGARRGNDLRHAISLFNVIWSSALVGALVVISPMLELGTMAPFAAAGVGHLLSLVVLRRFPVEPGAHLHDDAHTTPANYPKLLMVHRVLLPTCYMVMYAMTPLLPEITTALKLPSAWQTPFASIWLAGRVLGFMALQQFSGWRGKWLTATWGTGFMLVGFALVVLGPTIANAAGSNAVGLIAAGLGLASFGVGAAGIYCGALYYAMEVGDANVDAGGTHEAMIGLGYTVGPICAFIPTALATPNLLNTTQTIISPQWRDPLIVGLVGILCLAAVALAILLGNRRTPARYP